MSQEGAQNQQAKLASDKPVGTLEVVATFNGPMPTGVTVSKSNRIFVNFPRWGDDVPFTVAELKNGSAVAYPNAEINRQVDADAARHFISVQSVVVDPQDRLWVLDTGAPMLKNTVPNGPKLVGIDLATNQVIKTILFPPLVAGPNSYMNDVRFDLSVGDGGFAYITDSSSDGPNGIVVVDLASGKSWRRLNKHPSTDPEPGFLPTAEGRPLYQTEPGKPAHRVLFGADGIAISADGSKLFYSPTTGHTLYSVSTRALRDQSMSDDAVAATVETVTGKGPSDGMESDTAGNVYAGDYETDSIEKILASGMVETIVHDPRLIWPDTMSLADDGYLYVTANQLNRQPTMHNGQDLRQKPYVLFRIKTDSKRIRLMR
ncbi:MAG: L-dopachrome tautomerase-related protein [Acidobacteriaceae bacterium]